MIKSFYKSAVGIMIALAHITAYAHDPVFGIGPHMIFKNGFETSIGLAQDKARSYKGSELSLEAVYGITGDWTIGIEIPYAIKNESSQSSSGLSDLQIFTKYRFWRKDTLGLQQSAAILLALNGQNGDHTTTPPLGNGAVDKMIGLTWGYEGIEKYRWASVRYVVPGENAARLQQGKRWLLDLVIGWRPTPPEYTRPDTVWLLELNGELSDRAELNGAEIANSGGTEWFLSPGIFWTTRNFAIKSGIQIPVSSDLNGNQAASDYRFKLSFEWHL